MKFKRKDRVIVTGGFKYQQHYIGQTGTVADNTHSPFVLMDETGEQMCFAEDELELISDN